jgi:PAS domain S-box-containing protein
MKRTAVDSSEGFSGDLKQQEDKLGVIIKSAPVGIGEISLEPPQFKWVNEATCRILEYTEEELLAMNPFDLIAEESKQLFQERMRKIVAGEKVSQSVDYKLKTKNGRILWANLNINLLNKNDKVIGGLIFAQNITKRKNAEEALIRAKEQSEQDRKRLETILETFPSAVVIIEANGKFSYQNKRAMQLYGVNYVGFDLPAHTAKVKALKPDNTPFPLDEMPVSHSLKFGQEVKNVEMTIQRADGKRIPLLVSSVPLFDVTGKTSSAIAIFEDITELKQAEEKLKESEERFFKAFQLNPTPMAISFVDGEFIDVNCSFERLTGFTRDEVVGKRGVALEMYGSSSEREELIRKLQQEGHVYNFAITLNTKSMKQVNVLISFEKIKLQNKLRVLGAAIDVTEKQQLQNKLEKYSRSLEELVKQKTEQLREAERLAAIGQTAGMVGHDLRNPLQVIIGDLYLLESDLASMPEGEEKEGMKESMAAIKKAINYMDKIVTDLQYYAKPLKTNIQKTNLEEICQEILLEKSFPENIDVRYVIEDEAKNILAEPALLKRILNNLVDNAVQAMPDGGKLELHANREPDKVIITVQDSGVGIPEEHKDKLFTPLFTTKAKGQGFGLAVVKRITEALNGTVTFESEEGKGSKFTVRLPVAKK